MSKPNTGSNSGKQELNEGYQIPKTTPSTAKLPPETKGYQIGDTSQTGGTPPQTGTTTGSDQGTPPSGGSTES
jgi:hypothetical protein